VGFFVAMGLAFFCSLWLSGVSIRAVQRLRFGMDNSKRVQRVHLSDIPRVGGLAVFIAFIIGILGLAWISEEFVAESAFLIVCCLPAFAIGLLEDITEKAKPKIRLFVPVIGACLAWWLLDAKLTTVDIPLADSLLRQYPIITFILTMIAVSGVTHAVNIVDGCNGLSSFVGMAVLSVLALVAWEVGDQFVFATALLGAASLFGFFLWNFPLGRIFIGDGGAYFTGFLIAVLSIMLVRHNPEVSPWFPLLAMLYPIWETLYSMYRRAVIRKLPMMQPDKLHLHQLIYFRLIKFLISSPSVLTQAVRSSIAATYLWVITLMCVLPAALFWSNSAVLKLCSLLFIVSYLVVHTRLVQFRAPKFIAIRHVRKDVAGLEQSECLVPGEKTKVLQGVVE